MARRTRTRGPQRSGVGAGVDDNAVVNDIYAATLRLMERNAFGDMSVAQILAEAAVSRATFYSYFPSKFAVLRGLLARAMDDIFDTVSPFLRREQSDPPESALERSILGVAQTWRRHRSVLRAVNHHWPSEPEIKELWLSIAARFIDAGAEEIERERALGLIASTGPARRLAATLFWGTERVLYIAGLGVEPDLPDEDAAVPVLVGLWAGTLYGHPH